MPAAQHRYGDCQVAVPARLAGDQPVRVQGVTAVASRTGREHLSVTVEQVLLYLEDRAALDALDALVDAVRRAQALADRLFGPADDGFTRAQAPERAAIAKTGGSHTDEPRRRAVPR
jgi:hypothetical protein